MAKMLPDIDPAEIENIGERLLYSALAKMPDDWVVRYNYPYTISENNRLREGQGDFIVIVPKQGLMFLETKGSRSFRISDGEAAGFRCEDAVWYRIDRYGKETSTGNPFEQASKVKHDVVNIMAKQLWRKDKRDFPGLFGHAVVYPQGKLVGQLCASQTPMVLITHKDIDNLQETIMNSFAKWGGDTRGQLFTDQRMTQVVEFLSDTCQFLKVVAGDVDDDEIHIEELTKNQFDAFKALRSNRRIRVNGVAGSGKTLFALWSAAELADRFKNENKRVLFLCFNRLLASWLKVRFGYIQENFEIRSFFELCRETCGSAGLAFEPPPQGTPEHHTFWKETAADLFSKALDDLGQQAKYDAIFVDEAQDFAPDWWFPVEELLRNSDESKWCFFLDPDQAGMYGNAGGYPMQGFVTYSLDQNCRNTKRIVSYCENILPGQITAFDRSPDGVNPVVHSYIAAVDGRRQLVRNIVRQLTGEGFHPSRIAILSPWSLNNVNSSSLCGLNAVGNIPIVSPNLGNTDQGMLDWIEGRAILGATTKSFKGLEADCIILTDVPTLNTTQAWNRSDFYVAASRAKHRLEIIPSSDSAEKESRELIGK